jgi:hypothetical protein
MDFLTLGNVFFGRKWDFSWRNGSNVTLPIAGSIDPYLNTRSLSKYSLLRLVIVQIGGLSVSNNCCPCLDTPLSQGFIPGL